MFLRKVFSVSQNDTPLFSSMECMDLLISHGNSSIRLITIYRPTRSKKNCVTVGTFFDEFLLHLETVNLIPNYLLINGDYNFHLDIIDDNSASVFRDLLISTGLKQHVEVPTLTIAATHWISLLTDKMTMYSQLSLFSLIFQCTMHSQLSLFGLIFLLIIMLYCALLHSQDPNLEKRNSPSINSET